MAHQEKEARLAISSWQTEEAMAEAARARILARGERTVLPPVLCLARGYEEAHPRPDLDEFILQYRRAGSKIDMTIVEGEGEGLTRNLTSSATQQALEQILAFLHQHLWVSQEALSTPITRGHARSGGCEGR